MAKIQERDLLKALNELEELVKGDALENADTEGGLSTEGTPLSSKAPSGRSDAVKSGDKMAKMMSASDMESGVEDHDSGKKTKKALPPPKGGADSDSDDESSDDGSGDDESSDDASSGGDDASSADAVSKAMFMDQEPIRKAVEISTFIEAMVDQTSAALDDVQKSLATVSSGLLGRLEKSETAQRDFNSRLAKAIVSIGNQVNELSGLIGKLAGQPHIPARKAVLSKSEVVEPTLAGSAGGSDLAGMTPDRVQEWLVQKSIEGKVDPVMVTVFEQNGYNPEVLPPHVRKALVNDLQK